jgi:hypothetical protein
MAAYRYDPVRIDRDGVRGPAKSEGPPSARELVHVIARDAQRQGWFVWGPVFSGRGHKKQDYTYLRPLLHGQPPLILLRDARVIFVYVTAGKRYLTAAEQEAANRLSQCGEGVELYVCRPQDLPDISRTLAAHHIENGSALADPIVDL